MSLARVMVRCLQMYIHPKDLACLFRNKKGILVDIILIHELNEIALRRKGYRMMKIDIWVHGSPLAGTGGGILALKIGHGSHRNMGLHFIKNLTCAVGT